MSNFYVNFAYFRKLVTYVVYIMATSLTKHLKKFQLPGQSGLLEKESNNKTSLLFTAQETANIDIDSIVYVDQLLMYIFRCFIDYYLQDHKGFPHDIAVYNN